MKLKCDYCGKVTEHTPIGTQEFPKYTLELYNCKQCGSTHSVKVSNGPNKPGKADNYGDDEWVNGW